MFNPANAITNIELAEIPEEIFWSYIRSSTGSWSILKDNCSSVDTKQKTVTISTDAIERKLPTDSQKDSDVMWYNRFETKKEVSNW